MLEGEAVCACMHASATDTGSPKADPRVAGHALQKCYSGVTVVLQWRYSSVTVVLQWCHSVCVPISEGDGVPEGRPEGGGPRRDLVVIVMVVVMVIRMIMVVMIRPTQGWQAA
jgi:hypothetical protein